MYHKVFFILFFCVCLILTSCSERTTVKAPEIDGKEAYKYVEKLVEFGPRPSGSDSLKRQTEYIAAFARKAGAKVAIQEFNDLTPKGKIVFRNIVAETPGRSSDFIIVGSHYDTKLFENNKDVFVGANDGASSSGLLMEMLRVTAESPDLPPYRIRWIWFDGEECIDGYTDNDGLHGSKYYAGYLKKKGEISDCRGVIILDMIGDRDLTVAFPADSPKFLVKQFYQAADKLGYRKYFKMNEKTIIDDHNPFAEKNIPAIDVIDFNFPAWHTKYDTIDQVAPESLKIVGNVAMNVIWNFVPVSE